jgi:hypothetical protein
MTDWVAWFRYQLQASGDGFLWAARQLPPAYHLGFAPDPQYLGTWEPARHVWHVAEYERCLALPSMRQWAGGPLPDGAAWHDDDQAWAAVRDQPLEQHCAAFQAIRQAQIALLDELADADWQAPRETLWGNKPLAMIVTKTFQHTYEHGDTLLRMGLWWEHIEQAIAAHAAQSSA